MKQFFLVTLILSISIIEAIACSCRPPGELTSAEFFEAEIIFIGKITSVEETGYTITATFSVMDDIKVPGGTREIEVLTPVSSAACGLSFKEGAVWYVWGYNEGSGKYSSNICTRSMRLNDQGTSTNPGFEKEMNAIKSFKNSSGSQVFETPAGKVEGKIKNGLKKGWWKYYDTQGNLYKKVCYKKGIQKKEKILAEPVTGEITK